MSTNTALDDIKAKHSRACSELDRLAGGNPGSTWRWSIPADPERDSDLILSDSLASVPRLLAALEAVEGVLNARAAQQRVWMNAAPEGSPARYDAASRLVEITRTANAIRATITDALA